MGIKAKPPDPLNSTHEKDQVTHHPWNLVRGLTHLPLPFPHPFLNTYHLLKNIIKKKTQPPQNKKMGGNLQGNQFPPLELSGLPTSPPTPRQVDLVGGGARARGILNFPEQRRAKEGGRRDRVSRGGGRAGRGGERESGQTEGKEVQGGMKEMWAALGRPDRGNRPGMRLGSRGQSTAAPAGGRGAVRRGQTPTPAAGCFC